MELSRASRCVRGGGVVVAVVVVLVVARGAIAHAQPAAPPPATATWADAPALIARVTAPVEVALRGCLEGRLPRTLTVSVSRAASGASAVAMPMPGVGGRGLTDEERCLARVIATIEVPALPAEIDRMLVGLTVVAAGAAPPAVEPAFASWRDPAATVRAVFDDARRAALANCDARPRTVRFVLDRRGRATRVWMPAWQFHADDGSGTTPPGNRRVKACLARAIRGWAPPQLPRAMAELEVAFAVAP